MKLGALLDAVMPRTAQKRKIDECFSTLKVQITDFSFGGRKAADVTIDSLFVEICCVEKSHVDRLISDTIACINVIKLENIIKKTLYVSLYGNEVSSMVSRIKLPHVKDVYDAEILSVLFAERWSWGAERGLEVVFSNFRAGEFSLCISWLNGKNACAQRITQVVHCDSYRVAQIPVDQTDQFSPYPNEKLTRYLESIDSEAFAIYTKHALEKLSACLSYRKELLSGKVLVVELDVPCIKTQIYDKSRLEGIAREWDRLYGCSGLSCVFVTKDEHRAKYVIINSRTDASSRGGAWIEAE